MPVESNHRISPGSRAGFREGPWAGASRWERHAWLGAGAILALAALLGWAERLFWLRELLAAFLIFSLLFLLAAAALLILLLAGKCAYWAAQQIRAAVAAAAVFARRRWPASTGQAARTM